MHVVYGCVCMRQARCEMCGTYRRQSGFFLIELMCALALSAFVLLGASRFVVQTYRYYRSLASSCTRSVQALSAVTLCVNIGNRLPTDKRLIKRAHAHELVWERNGQGDKHHYEGIRYQQAKKRLEYCRGTFYEDSSRWSPGSCCLVLYPVHDVALQLYTTGDEVHGMSCSFGYHTQKYTGFAHARTLEMNE